MSRLRFRALLLVLAALLTVGLSACGDKDQPHTHGETEGAYVDVGGLTYQVQISRQLNPNDPEDRAYLVGIPSDQRQPAPDETWFAVFVLVQNSGDKPAPTADSFHILDTQENVYTPLSLPGENIFRYPGQVIVPPGEQIPGLETIPYQNASVGGVLLLFKLKNFTIDNRPLELVIENPSAGGPREATVNLDV